MLLPWRTRAHRVWPEQGMLTLPVMGSEAVSINSNPVWGSASRNGPWRQNRAQTIPEGFTADTLEADERQELLKSHTATGTGSRAAPSVKHSPAMQAVASPGTPAPAPTRCPTQPRYLEIGLAIEARCSDITGPINAAGGQKYQVTGEGLICFHFYYVSNLEERKHSHEKSSQLLLDGYNLASLKA